MVALAERYTAKVATKNELSEEDTSQLQNCLLNLGIQDPVTRASFKSGNAYHRELAKELADFLKAPMVDSKGIMTLTDVYCLYTRARGTQLVSPDDLINACRLFEELSLSFRLKTFPNGIIIVEQVTQTDASIADTLLELAKANEYLTATSYASIRSVPVMLAEEHLRFAERLGKLCRDDSIQGLRFYPNRFLAA